MRENKCLAATCVSTPLNRATNPASLCRKEYASGDHTPNTSTTMAANGVFVAAQRSRPALLWSLAYSVAHEPAGRIPA